MEEKTNFSLTEEQTDVAPASQQIEKRTPHHHHSSHGSSHHRHHHHHHHHHNNSSRHHSHHHHSSGSSSHHSSHRSSSRKKTSTKKKKKPTIDEHSKLRMFFAFLLFLSITATAVFSGLKISMLNENRISEIFTNGEYINALYNDVLQYSDDMCMKCGLPEGSLKHTITYKRISNIEHAYVHGAFNMDEKYSETTYIDMIDDFSKELEESVNETVKANNLSVDKSQNNSGAKMLSEKIASYFKEKIEFNYISDLQSIINISAPVTNIGIVLFAVFALAFFLLTVSLADKSYRAIRSVVFSIFAAAEVNLLLVILIGIISMFKDLVIYPSYLCASFMQYITSCVLTFLVISALLFFLGISIAALVWKLKRNNE